MHSLLTTACHIRYSPIGAASKELKIVDLTDDEGRVQLKEEWATSAGGAGSVALRVELSICWGSELLAKVPAVCVD